MVFSNDLLYHLLDFYQNNLLLMINLVGIHYRCILSLIFIRFCLFHLLRWRLYLSFLGLFRPLFSHFESKISQDGCIATAFLLGLVYVGIWMLIAISNLNEVKLELLKWFILVRLFLIWFFNVVHVIWLWCFESLWNHIRNRLFSNLGHLDRRGKTPVDQLLRISSWSWCQDITPLLVHYSIALMNYAEKHGSLFHEK